MGAEHVSRRAAGPQDGVPAVRPRAHQVPAARRAAPRRAEPVPTATSAPFTGEASPSRIRRGTTLREVSARPVGSRVQRAAVGAGVAPRVRQAVSGPPIIQRITAGQAANAIATAGIDNGWYTNVAVPALTAIATKAGQTYAQFLAPLSAPQFMTRINELQTTAMTEPVLSSFASFGSFLSQAVNPTWVDSTVYPGFRRYGNTNLLALTAGNFNGGPPSAALTNFAADYLAGNLVWYRGVAVCHFSWEALRQGIVASEGTADLPTFTMGHGITSRWLPGVDNQLLAHNVALAFGGAQNPGLNDVATNIGEVPTGAVVRFAVPTTAPVAFLNPGEAVVRGPLVGAQFTIDSVTIMGPATLRDAVGAVAPAQLPPAAPYGAGVGSVAIQNWSNGPNGALAWAALH